MFALMLAPAYVPTHKYAVSSAMRRLTSGFGMEPGVPASPWKPTSFWFLHRFPTGSSRRVRYKTIFYGVWLFMTMPRNDVRSLNRVAVGPLGPHSFTGK